MLNIMHMHVMFRLVGGMHPPPKSATGCSISITTIVSTELASDEIDSIKYLTYTNYGHRATYCSRLRVSCAQ